ncbi:DUF6680 family protein [Idiomarina abyssalis]|uniref:DUF6680 family protein n=1 Tax=Idiomarina abyssalis TaxID=86102 RepID=UPI001C9485D0|nr:DUF6680 family protein [Idiomarina abyssalis]QZN91905.1 hypothetical protein K5X84_05235 [Idiomarina abyssalis]
MEEVVIIGIPVSSWVMIAAVFLGPIAAVQIQKFLESRKEETQNRIKVFKDLMTTRASTLAYQHVSALNMVGLEFRGKQFSKVISAWNIYLDHLNSYPDDEELGKVWVDKSNDLLSDLLYEMGISLGFEFDKVHIKKAGYIPKGYADAENEQIYIRKATIEVLEGKRPLPLDIVQMPFDQEAVDAQKELLRALAAHYAEGKPFPVIVVNEES